MRTGALTVCDATRRASKERIYIAGKRASWADLIKGSFDLNYAQLGLNRQSLMDIA